MGFDIRVVFVMGFGGVGWIEVDEGYIGVRSLFIRSWIKAEG